MTLEAMITKAVTIAGDTDDIGTRTICVAYAEKLWPGAREFGPGTATTIALCLRRLARGEAV